MTHSIENECVQKGRHGANARTSSPHTNRRHTRVCTVCVCVQNTSNYVYVLHTCVCVRERAQFVDYSVRLGARLVLLAIFIIRYATESTVVRFKHTYCLC